MLFWSWFFISGFGLLYDRGISTNEVVIRLKSYGFDQGGSFRFSVTGENISGTHLILEDVGYRRYTSIDLCRNNASIASLYRVCKKLDASGFWSGTINVPNVYTPIVLNCKKIELSVGVSFRNPKTFLDSRDEYLPWGLVILSFVHTTVTLVWIVNALMNRKFYIAPHMFMSAACGVKAIQMWYHANYWCDRIRTDNLPFLQQMMLPALSAFAHAFFFTVNAMICLGWGIYREFVPVIEWVKVGCICLTGFIFSELSSSDAGSGRVGLIVVIVCIVAWYASIIHDCITTVDFWRTRFTNNDENADRKQQMVADFSEILFRLIVMMVILRVTTAFVPFWDSLYIFSCEFFFLVFVGIDLGYLLYRKSYEGDENDTDIYETPPVVAMRDPDGNCDIAFLR